MIHELRMYTLKPGTLNKVVEASGTVAQRIRGGDAYGKLEGHWSSEIGQLNQFVHLWAYENLEEMRRQRGELMSKEVWRKEYLPLVRPHILRQNVQILRPVFPMKQPDSEGNFYELRSYRLKIGAAAEWCAKMAEHMPAREKYSKNIGLWTADFPDPNVVTHMWVYSSFEQRMKARTASQNDATWKEFLGYGAPLIEEMHSTILLPSPYSPRK